MTWDDIMDVLYDGTNPEINALVCPDCGKPIQYAYSEQSNSVTVVCDGCGYHAIEHGCNKVPNCANKR